MRLGHVLVASAVAVAGLLAVPTPALADAPCDGGFFCAYDNPGFQGELMRSNEGPGAKVNVADDRTESGVNNTPYVWVAMNRRFLLPDVPVGIWLPGQSIPGMGSFGNKADHFDVN